MAGPRVKLYREENPDSFSCVLVADGVVRQKRSRGDVKMGFLLSPFLPLKFPQRVKYCLTLPPLHKAPLQNLRGFANKMRSQGFVAMSYSVFLISVGQTWGCLHCKQRIIHDLINPRVCSLAFVSLFSVHLLQGEFKVSERYVTMSDLIAALKEKRVKEMFGAGTACVVCPVSTILYLGEVRFNFTALHAGFLTYS